jgi:FAD dependent oxidoreductase TIGR03364
MATKKKAIVVGAGIVGLASARTLSLQGYQVTIIERNEKAIGASIRNFGMLWPIGQPDGLMYNRAIRSKMIWKEIADSVGLWYEECGSLHLAANKEEWQVLQELLAGFQAANRPCSLMSPEEIKNNYKGIQTKEIMGGLFSPTETIVDPREAIAAAASYLEEYLDVDFIWGKNFSEVSTGKLRAGNETLLADLIVVCNGADFETLFPEIFAALPITKCKLQMMRFQPGANEKRMGVSVCGGLSLIHYPSFKIAPSLKALEEKFKQEMPEYIKWGMATHMIPSIAQS